MDFLSNVCLLFSVTAQDLVDIIKAQLQRYNLFYVRNLLFCRHYDFL